MKILENVPLAPLTYYKIGGPARFYCQPESTDDLKIAAEFLKQNKVPYFVLGAGSNILVADEGFNGLILHTNKLDRTLVRIKTAAGTDALATGCSVMVIQSLRIAMSEGLAGLEFLVGIPGNMGGVFYMNAGTVLGEAKDALLEISLFDLSTQTKRNVQRDQMNYTYRAQKFLNPHDIILGGKLKVTPTDPKVVQEQVTDLLNKRKKSQPIDKPSCGSVFKNPRDHATLKNAWQVVEKIGLRGHQIGGAQVSLMHTNYIVNLGGATAHDVLALISEAKTRAKDQLGIALEEEVKYVTTATGKHL